VSAIAIPATQGGEKPTYDVGIVVTFFPDGPPQTSSSGAVVQRTEFDHTETDAIESLGPPLNVRVLASPLHSLSQGEDGLRQGQYDVVVAGDQVLTTRVPSEDDTGKKAQLIAALTNVVRLKRLGPDAVAALQTPVTVRGVERADSNSQARTTAFFGTFILFAFLQQYGAWVLIGVIEEKASRVVEVLLAAVRPRQLVGGKVLGIGTVALAQGALVALAAIVTAQATGANVFQGTTRYAIAWTLLWFVLGYSVYALAYAAVGSLASRQADAQNASFPLAVPLLVGYLSSVSLLNGGDPSAFVRVLSFFPLTAPMVMPMLIGLGKVATWEIAVSIALIVASIVVIARVAGNVYSRAILHTGQRLKLRQVMRGDFSAE